MSWDRRLLRTGDLGRIVGLEIPQDWLDRRATVRSGRTGVAPGAAPPEVRALADTRIETGTVPVTPPSAGIVQVWAEGPAGPVLLGIGDVGATRGGPAVLELR